MKIEEITCNITKSRIYESDNDSLSASQIEVIKSLDIPKEKIIKLDDDTIFQFDCLIDDDEQYLSFKLSEIDAVAPYIYIKNIKLDEIKRVHKMFRACDDLTEVKNHIDYLFKNNKIKLSQKKNDEIIFEIKAFYISYEDEFKIVAERRMVNNKDAMLLKLYDIQKKKIKMLKEIENYVKNNNVDKNKMLNKINEIKEEYDK